MKIIGIDPAPLKKNVIFDGETFRRLSVDALKAYLDGMGEDVLVCWNAPLNRGDSHGHGGFFSRRIERFLRSRMTGMPEGLGAVGYAACPHWTVSQYCLGYPVINEASVKKEGYRFELLESGSCPGMGRYVVETQPAASLWLLLRDRVVSREWPYRGNGEFRQEIVDKLFKLPCFSSELRALKHNLEDEYRLSHDQFPRHLRRFDEGMVDAFVAWLTGRMYSENGGRAKILGDRRSGTMLLAYDREFFDAFDRYGVG